MSWVAVNKDGSENLFQSNKPFRNYLIRCTDKTFWSRASSYDSVINLPKGSISKLIYRELRWDDEPAELV